MALGLGIGLGMFEFGGAGIGPIGPVGELDFANADNSALIMACGFFGV